MWISYKDKEVEPVESVHMNIYQSNTYKKGSSWLHFDDEPKVQDLNGFKSGVNRHLLSLCYFYKTDIIFHLFLFLETPWCLAVSVQLVWSESQLKKHKSSRWRTNSSTYSFLAYATHQQYHNLSKSMQQYSIQTHMVDFKH